ncbi:hypothetical protein [Streptomyces sp. NPDC101132]|uniref:hypothetical protein n=1 Tax=Streptomyces sp. NPDC101132 TaxID=3366110 RepID=UPI0037F30901
MAESEHMPFLNCDAVRWIGDEPFPGLIEVRITDVHNRQWSVIDKAAVFDDAGNLTPSSNYPVRVKVLCEILDGAPGSAPGTVTVSITPWGLESVEGQVEFQVHSDELTTS